MSIPKTKGYTEIVKIAEAALKGNNEMAIKYIKKYIIKFPESDLIYPFTHLLKGENNPSGLTNYTQCGGCGATNPNDRCIGCLHDFTIKSDRPE